MRLQATIKSVIRGKCGSPREPSSPLNFYSAQIAIDVDFDLSFVYNSVEEMFALLHREIVGVTHG